MSTRNRQTHRSKDWSACVLAEDPFLVALIELRKPQQQKTQIKKKLNLERNERERKQKRKMTNNNDSNPTPSDFEKV